MSVQPSSIADELNFYSLYAVLQSGMWLQADLEKYLSRYGFSQGRFAILLALIESPGNALVGNEIASRLGVSKPTVTKMIEKLLAEKYLVINAGQGDRRKKQYGLTVKAHEALRSVIPGYLERLREMSGDLADSEKKNLIDLLSRLNFLDPKKIIIKQKQKTITEKGSEIRELCSSGWSADIDRVMGYLNGDTDIPTTKLVDYYLSTVSNPDGLRRIEHYLFHGTQIQRNYCTLYFARINAWTPVNKAYEMGLIDSIQAYAR